MYKFDKYINFKSYVIHARESDYGYVVFSAWDKYNGVDDKLGEIISFDVYY